MCACKFRLNVQKPAITTILPVCRCRHRDETARDSGPGTSEKPACHPTQTRPRGTKNHNPLEAKRLPQPAQNPHLVINEQGASFYLPTPDADVLDRAAYMAAEYCNLLTRTPSAPENPVELRATLQRLTVQFSRVKAERIALAETAGFFISDEQLKRATTHWRKVDTLETVIEDHHTQHRENGPNQKRVVTTFLVANDPRFNIMRQIINTEGGHFYMPPNFVRAKKPPHSATCKPDCYRSTTKPSHKVLLFRLLSDLKAEEIQNIHCANEYHWRPEPGKVADRPLLDCSNAPPGVIPLNSDFTRLRDIERYQQVKPPHHSHLPLMYKCITILVHAKPAGRTFAHKQYHGDGRGRTNPDPTKSILTATLNKSERST